MITINLIDISQHGVLSDWSNKLVIRGTPKDTKGLIAVSNSCVINVLQADGYLPRYIDDNYAYFGIEDMSSKGMISKVVKYIYTKGDNKR